MLLTGYLQMQFGDRPTCWRRCFRNTRGKAAGAGQRHWAATLKRDKRAPGDGRHPKRSPPRGWLRPTGRSTGGRDPSYGTGFQASKFLTPMRVKGRGGADLHAQWNGDARAYMGITVPNFPNCSCSMAEHEQCGERQLHLLLPIAKFSTCSVASSCL